MKYWLVIFVVLIATSSLWSQTRSLDSLRKIVDNHPAKDTVRVNMIINYVEAAVNENTNMLLPYLDEEIGISKKQHYKHGLQSGYITAQLYYSDRGDLTASMLYADSAFAVLEGDTAAQSIINKAVLHHNLGSDYIRMSDYEKALDHFIKATGILEVYRPEVMPSIYTALAEVSEKLLQYDEALEYDQKAIAAAEKYGNKTSITRRYLNYIARLITGKEFDKADSLLRKIEPSVKEIDETFSSFLFYQNRGALLQEKKKYKEAIADFKQAYKYAVNNDDKYEQISILASLSQCLMDAGQQKEAGLYMDSLLHRSVIYRMNAGRLSAYDLLDSSIKEMRRVAHDMMPEMLVKYGLNTALKEFFGEVNRSGAIHAGYQPVGMEQAAIEQTVAVTVYRIVQELVNNAIKHPVARNVVVQAHASEQGKLLSVTVEDDGKGFDTALLKNAKGMGWNNIQNRVDFLNGKLDVLSAPGKGTSVMIEINL